MAERKKPRKPGKNGKKVPKGDHLTVRPIRRSPAQQEEAEVSQLLAHHWDILTPAQQKTARKHAFATGEVAAEDGSLADWQKELEDDLDGPLTYHELYRRVAIRRAKDVHKVINDVEYECWRYETQDPRIIWFRRGMLRQLGEAELAS